MSLKIILFLKIVTIYCNDPNCFQSAVFGTHNCNVKTTSFKFRIITAIFSVVQSFLIFMVSTCTVMFLNFWTDKSEQTVKTQIRLHLEEQFDQGVHCFPFHLHRLDALIYGKFILFKF